MPEPRRWRTRPPFEYRTPGVAHSPSITVLAVGPEDRDAVEAVIAQAIADHWEDTILDADEARAVFDALAGGAP